MSHYNCTQDVPATSSASVAYGDQKMANVYDYDSQAPFQIQENSLFSSGPVPHGYNPFSYLDNDQGAKSTFQGQTMSSMSHSVNELGLSYPSLENSHSHFLNNNGESTSHMIAEAGNPKTVLDNFNPFLINQPSNILGNPGFINNNGKSTSSFQGNPSTILGNPENSHNVFLNNNSISTSHMMMEARNPSTIFDEFDLFTTSHPHSLNPDPYFPINSSSGDFINNTKRNNMFHPISGLEIEGTESRFPAEEQDKSRFSNSTGAFPPSFAGRVGTNLRATPPSISNRGRDIGSRQSRREDQPMFRQPTVMDAINMKKLTEKERKRKEIPRLTISRPAPHTPKRRKSVRLDRAPVLNTNAHDWEDDEVMVLTRAQFEFSIGGKRASKGKNAQEPIGSAPKSFQSRINYDAMANNCLRPVKVEPDLFGADNYRPSLSYMQNQRPVKVEPDLFGADNYRPSLSYMQNQGPSNLLNHEVMPGAGKSPINALVSNTKYPLKPWDKHPNQYGNVTSYPYPIEGDNNLFLGNNPNLVFENKGLENNGLGNTSNIPHHFNDVLSERRVGKNPIVERNEGAFEKISNVGHGNEPLYGGSEFQQIVKGSGPSGEGDDQLNIFSNPENFGLDWTGYNQMQMQSQNYDQSFKFSPDQFDDYWHL